MLSYTLPRRRYAQHAVFGGRRVTDTGKRENIQVFVVDEHDIVRHVVRRIMEEEGDLCICGEAASSDVAFQMLPACQPNVILLDLALKGDDGLALTKRLHTSFREAHILVFSMHSEMLFAERVLRMGAEGYLQKGCTSEVLVDAIRCVARGSIYISREMQRTILDRLRGRLPLMTPDLAMLTDREVEVLLLIHEGCTTREIASRLQLSPKTIESHRSHIRRKLALPDNIRLTEDALHPARVAGG